ncbi:flavodoxin [Selenomonas sp. F0473]|uniref:flavodoxin n=1 Tax=Selenomonas sp. F0473 TaxID=999423 RepID=UPI0025DD6701|nr:flavodoxin [Selenomonas sp. F0473]
MADAQSRPALLEQTTNLSAYDTSYIGFLIWWYTAPHIINSFVESNDLTGKRIVLFATSGGSNIKKAMEDLRQAYPQLNIVGGKMLNGAVSGDIDDGR